MEVFLVGVDAFVVLDALFEGGMLVEEGGIVVDLDGGGAKGLVGVGPDVGGEGGVLVFGDQRGGGGGGAGEDVLADVGVRRG